MDKRNVSGMFRDRLKTLLAREGVNQSSFATSVGIDRSALSQLLSGSMVRLPRAETLVAIASQHKVSLDWLLGLTEDETLGSDLREAFAIEEEGGGNNETLLAKWRAEAAGTKIRYVPAGIPDLLRSPALIEYESALSRRGRALQGESTQHGIEAGLRLDTDMEACMPRHTLDVFAGGLGIWNGMAKPARRAQLDHMASLLDELYPVLRLYLYDGRVRYSAPFTIFGQVRAAIYIGDMYLVLNATAAIRALTGHFANLIRAAEVNAHEVASYARNLEVT
jgi:transcriptional regulator with XRE-family HTH domain